MTEPVDIPVDLWPATVRRLRDGRPRWALGVAVTELETSEGCGAPVLGVQNLDDDGELLGTPMITEVTLMQYRTIDGRRGVHTDTCRHRCPGSGRARRPDGGGRS